MAVNVLGDAMNVSAWSHGHNKTILRRGGQYVSAMKNRFLLYLNVKTEQQYSARYLMRNKVTENPGWYL